MKNVNLFTANLEGRAKIQEIAATRKATAAALANFEASINAEFAKVLKDTDRRARNVGNAAKGKYHTALQVVANCYPYQSKTGDLMRRATLEDGRKVWAIKKLTAASARGIVRDSLNNFTRNVGAPVVVVVVEGAPVGEE